MKSFHKPRRGNNLRDLEGNYVLTLDPHNNMEHMAQHSVTFMSQFELGNIILQTLEARLRIKILCFHIAGT